ncbi:AAA family ATPase [Limibaculum sp. FT325]|uniref:ATP-binding protein n=1 Tax=Thermohalobaculum sediminis TaxID=2939436 RepID=UPI0020BD979F|nr:adenylate/guanylate cyclase domain-containing protein [Limibaculum sediminis]MCL5779014.1 AAA family ATPase [Limibaculum sediminis]
MAGSIGAWLAALGLDEYAERFERQRITPDILPDLSEADLEKLDIPLGDRKRLMRAIAALGPADAEPEAPPAEDTPPGFSDVTAAGQLRHLTVAFIDLVGSTALSAELDLEDYKNLIRSYHDVCAQIVASHGGYVAHFAGDGVLAYFGYPTAQEDDPERAALAALAVLREVPQIPHERAGPLAARIGIATGEVLIGGLVYEGLESIRAAVGETPNLAARLQALAEPGSVIVSADTHRLLGNAFVCEDAGTHALKGFREPVQTYRLREVRTAAARFESQQRGKQTLFVNRDEELGLMRRRWARALEGRGNVVLLSGEAGIGKSRLARELAGRAAAEPHLRLMYQCSALYTGTPLYPVAAHLEYAARFRGSDSGEEKLHKLETLLAEPDGSVPDLPIFARLLSLPHDETAPPLAGLNAAQIREATIRALVDRLFRLAGRRPVLVVFEDLHWIDPTTQELLDLLVERIEGHRVLMICTFRRDFVSRWSGLPNVTQIEINRLGPRESAAIVASLMQGRGAAKAPLEAIVEKTDGVPLFIEELTKAALDAVGVDREGGPGIGKGHVDPLALPSTLRDSLMARIDRLPLADKVMPVGAAIGRTFSHRAISSVTGLPENVLAEALKQLVDAELLTRRGQPPDAHYTFKHALVQDIAYESMLKSRRRALHGRIAQVLEDHFPELVDRRPEMVAQHCARAGEPLRAIALWERAAHRAIARSANSEAIAHLTAALRENAADADPARRVATEIRLREALCVPLEARAWGSEDITDNLDRLHDLVAEHGDETRLFTILHGLCGEHLIAGRAEMAHDFARKMLTLTARIAAPAFAVLSHHALGMSCFMLGSFDGALEHFEKAVQLRRGVEMEALRRYYVADPEVVDRAMQAWTLALTSDGTAGAVERARAAIERAHALSEVSGHDFSAAYGFSILASAQQSLGDPHAALELATRARQLSRRDGFIYWEAWSEIVFGWAMAMTGDSALGIERLKAGLEKYRATGSRQILGYGQALLADACHRTGRLTEGLAALEAIEEGRIGTSIRFYDRPIEAIRNALLAATQQGGTELEL